MSLLLRLVAIVVLCASASVEAHRYHFAHIELTRNASTGNIELVHQYFTSDLEQVLGAVGDKNIESLVAANVQFFNDDGVAIPISFIGSETDIGNTFVYQEIKQSDLDSVNVTAKFSTLLGQIRHQINTLNVVDANGKSLSYTFKSVNDRHRVNLP